MVEFDPKKLFTLSPDAEDWNNLVEHINWRNLECSVEGVLLYPKKGITKTDLESEITDWIGSQYSFGHGGLEIPHIGKRGKDWAVVYQINA